MNAPLRVVGLCIASFTAACSQWPDAGSGGMAERFGPMDQRLARLEAKAERLSAEGGRTYAAALSVEAEQRLTSANREMAGGLEEDARRDMNDADGMLEVIRLRIRQRGAQ